MQRSFSTIAPVAEGSIGAALIPGKDRLAGPRDFGPARRSNRGVGDLVERPNVTSAHFRPAVCRLPDKLDVGITHLTGCGVCAVLVQDPRPRHRVERYATEVVF